jgi:hypothetical protein
MTLNRCNTTNFSIKINLNRPISPELAATANLRAHSVVHSHFAKTGHILSSLITMKIKENISIIFFGSILML